MPSPILRLKLASNPSGQGSCPQSYSSFCLGIYLAASGLNCGTWDLPSSFAACKSFSWHEGQTPGHSMWDPVQAKDLIQTLHLGAQSPSHCTTGKSHPPIYSKPTSLSHRKSEQVLKALLAKPSPLTGTSIWIQRRWLSQEVQAKKDQRAVAQIIQSK